MRTNSLCSAQPILIVRRITLLESMRHYWVADPSTLPRGIEAMLTYLTFTDPDNALQTQVRKKAGISLVTVSKKTAKLLVQHVAQLTEMSKTVLSNPSITAPQQVSERSERAFWETRAFLAMKCTKLLQT